VQNMIGENAHVWAAFLAGYLALVSLISVGVTVYDKCVSRMRGRQRISEKTLLGLAAIGGSVFMYLTMVLIRHKTKHVKFMLGIPVIIVLQCAGCIAALNYLW